MSRFAVVAALFCLACDGMENLSTETPLTKPPILDEDPPGWKIQNVQPLPCDPIRLLERQEKNGLSDVVVVCSDTTSRIVSNLGRLKQTIPSKVVGCVDVDSDGQDNLIAVVENDLQILGGSQKYRLEEPSQVQVHRLDNLALISSPNTTPVLWDGGEKTTPILWAVGQCVTDGVSAACASQKDQTQWFETFIDGSQGSLVATGVEFSVKTLVDLDGDLIPEIAGYDEDSLYYANSQGTVTIPGMGQSVAAMGSNRLVTSSLEQGFETGQHSKKTLTWPSPWTSQPLMVEIRQVGSFSVFAADTQTKKAVLLSR